MTGIHVKTIPNSRKEFIEEKPDGRYIAAINAPREDGKANARLCMLLARHFAVPIESIRIIRGKTQSSKVVRID